MVPLSEEREGLYTASSGKQKIAKIQLLHCIIFCILLLPNALCYKNSKKSFIIGGIHSVASSTMFVR